MKFTMANRYMQRSPAGRADPDNKCVVLCPLHVTLTCVQVRVVPSAFDKYLRASRIAVPAAAFVSPPPLPFVANTTASADIGDVRVADCETGRL